MLRLVGREHVVVVEGAARPHPTVQAGVYGRPAPHTVHGVGCGDCPADPPVSSGSARCGALRVAGAAYMSSPSPSSRKKERREGRRRAGGGRTREAPGTALGAHCVTFCDAMARAAEPLVAFFDKMHADHHSIILHSLHNIPRYMARQTEP